MFAASEPKVADRFSVTEDELTVPKLLVEIWAVKNVPAGLELVAYPRPGCPWKGRADAESELLDLLRRAGHLPS